MNSQLWQKIAGSIAYFSLLPLNISTLTLPAEANTVTIISQYRQENTTICHSRNGRLQRCYFDADNDVEIVEVLSNTSCQGKWHYDSLRNFIEVWDGCRAKFQESRYSNNNNRNNYRSTKDNTIICSSDRGRRHRCDFNAPNGIEIIKVLSNAPCQGNWNYNHRRKYLEVRNGCRAKFRANSSWGNNFGSSGNSNNSRTITCESRRGNSRRCNFNTSNGVTLTRQLSSTSCKGNWFYGNGFVEVKNGCRAQFSSGRNNNSFHRQEYDRGYRDAQSGSSYNNYNNTEEYDRGYENGQN